MPGIFSLLSQHGKETLAVSYKDKLAEEAAGVKGDVENPKPENRSQKPDLTQRRRDAKTDGFGHGCLRLEFVLQRVGAWF